MFIEVDKLFTRPFREKEVKKAIVEFKDNFTEEDLRYMFMEEFKKDCSGRIIDCQITAGEQNIYTKKIFFAIKIIIDDEYDMIKIKFSIIYNPDDMTFWINGNPDTAEYIVYTEY